MAIQQPQDTDTLDSPSHALSHRVFANDENAPNKSVIVDANGNIGINGPITTTVVTKTDAYTIVALDSTILADASSGAFTITLPTASGIDGRQYTIKKIDDSTNIVTVKADGTDTIDGLNSQSLANQYESMTLVADGTNWNIT